MNPNIEARIGRNAGGEESVSLVALAEPRAQDTDELPPALAGAHWSTFE